MFNTLFVYSFILYIFNLFFFINFFYYFNNRTNFNLSTKILNIFIICLFFCIAGIPPVSLFFFKFYVVLFLIKQNLLTFLFLFSTFNTFVIYFYFKLLKHFNLTKQKLSKFTISFLSKKIYENFFFYFTIFIYFNLFFVFIIEFLSQCV